MMLREPWRTRLLFLSFAVTLVAVPIAGYSAVSRQGPVIPPGGPPPQSIINRMAERLGEDDADRLRVAMEPHVEQITIERAHMEAARRQMLLVLGQKSFDRDAARSAMENWQGTWTSWSRSFGEAILDGFGKVSPEGRQKLSELPGRRR